MRYVPRIHNQDLRQIFDENGWTTNRLFASSTIWAYSVEHKDGSRRVAFQAGWFRITAKVKEQVLKNVNKFFEENGIEATAYWHVTSYDYGEPAGKYDEFCIYIPAN